MQYTAVLRQNSPGIQILTIVQVLTLEDLLAKSSGKVASISSGLYARWRAGAWLAHALAERPDGSPLTEQLLQLIWQYQRLRRDDLRTTGAEPVKILHPGFWNHEAGPDFNAAVVQFGDAAPLIGDVELDLSPQFWRAHGHDQNPAYKRVILHVVWDAIPEPGPLPILALKPHLDAPLEELALALRRESRPQPPHVVGRCSAALRELSAEALADLLTQAARVRLESKAGQLQARARQVGWERALWEGLFGALGYKYNVWPMRRLSEVLPFLTADELGRGSTLALQARLLGISGFMPNDMAHAHTRDRRYLQEIWDVWWREREQFADVTLPPALWRLHGLRPANNPQRRLALAAHWLTQSDLPGRLERWFASADPEGRLSDSLLQVLQVETDEFWSRHWSFGSARMASPQPLIGPQRVTDLAINVILPWFWMRAVAGQNHSLQRLAEQCYYAWPKAEDNAVLRLACQRLFGASKAPCACTAATQQAILQIVRDFCDYSNALCEHCQFPTLVGEMCAPKD
jgi:hypothetical protein